MQEIFDLTNQEKVHSLPTIAENKKIIIQEINMGQKSESNEKDPQQQHLAAGVNNEEKSTNVNGASKRIVTNGRAVKTNDKKQILDYRLAPEDYNAFLMDSWLKNDK